MHVSMMWGYPGRDRGKVKEGLLQQIYRILYRRASLCYLVLFVEVAQLLMGEQLLMLGKDIRVDSYGLKTLSMS